MEREGKQVREENEVGEGRERMSEGKMGRRDREREGMVEIRR